METTRSDSKQSKNVLGGFGYVIAAGVCIVVGIIGLIVPVIPGLIFLAIAVIFLSRVSRRLDRWVKSNPFMSRTQSRMDSMGELNWSDRIRLSCWYAGYGLVKIGDISSKFIRKLRRHRT